jgi:hypothetical protein
VYEQGSISVTQNSTVVDGEIDYTLTVIEQGKCVFYEMNGKIEIYRQGPWERNLFAKYLT